jgi:hypothetical protein
MNAPTPWRSTARMAVVTAVLLGALNAAAVAQDRSDTGRTRPPAPVVAPKVEATPDAKPEFTAGGGRWIAGFGLGLVDAGDLFRVESADGSALAWGENGETEFTASRFTATVDPGAAATAFVGHRLGDGRWWLRAEVARGASDVAAEALLGQGGEVFQYDRLTFLTGSLAAEARLTAYPSHPYGSFGMTICRMTADEATDLDQTGLGFQAALGYRQKLGRVHVALETQMRHIAIDINDFRPSVASGAEPELIYAPADELWLFEIRLVGSRAW